MTKEYIVCPGKSVATKRKGMAHGGAPLKEYDLANPAHLQVLLDRGILSEKKEESDIVIELPEPEPAPLIMPEPEPEPPAAKKTVTKRPGRSRKKKAT